MRGAVALEDSWLKKTDSKDIAVYVVWSPQLGAQEKHVASAMRLVPDARARHYWDGSEIVGKAYQAILKLPAPAWDVWMVYDRDAMWKGDTPPQPAWWEHQLNAGPPELHLDATRWASHAEALLSVGSSHR
jgi:hypothetical protein